MLDHCMREPPPIAGKPLNILGVDYRHVVTPEGGDLYLTRFGAPYADLLLPENWREDEWFVNRRERLAGTSTVYRVPTKRARGRSLDLVVKWCRVGEEIPYDTLTFAKFTEAEFNGPFEEFSLLMELRDSPARPPMRTNRPLAIYVPPERLKLWQTGRSHSRIESKKAKFRDVELDMYRQYIFIYQWVRGLSAVEALERAMPDPQQRRAELEKLTHRVQADLAHRGFHVIDHKPAHFILRPRRDGTLLRDPDLADWAYALVDFELLGRTPDHEQRVQATRRADYLRIQRDRFAPPADQPFPAHLRAARVFDVDYVCGPADSTHGMLWVVGRNPALFDFFLPERWRRTPRRQLSDTNETFYTRTKDNINLVWKVSRVGEQPDADPLTEEGARLVEYGYNSPFEEFAMALELAARGVPTTYPRAIYMCGIESARPADYAPDPTRYESHRDLKTPDGRPLLSTEHNYLTVWGYWNGVDEVLAAHDQPYCEGINLLQAWTGGFITAEEMRALMAAAQERVRREGFEYVELKPSHFVLSLRPDNTLIRDADGTPAVRLCNFESLRRIAPA